MNILLEDKKALYKLSHNLISEKVERNFQSLNELKESAGNETKSSAGDKHETGRAMVHLEQEKMTRQLAVNQQMMNVFEKIEPDQEMDTVGLGSLVVTDKMQFFVSVALGKVNHSGNECFLLSLNSPIVQAFTGMKIGDQVNFNGQSYTIEELV